MKVKGGLLSMGDAHMAQGDSELDGTGIETSITGTFKLTLHKKKDFAAWQTALDFPLGEMASPPAWVVHGFSRTDYLATFKDDPMGIWSCLFVHFGPGLEHGFPRFSINLHVKITGMD